MRAALLIITPLLVLPMVCFSQADFRSGYIVTTKRDTVYGLVNYREGSAIYKYCEFKKDENQVSIEYSATDIKAYGFTNNKVYESRELSLNNELPKPVFLEVIVRGLVSLYKFESTFWVEKEDQKLKALTNESKETYVNDQRVLKYSNQYIATLNMLMVDCQETKSRIQTTELSEKSLTKLVEAYNTCRGASFQTYKGEKPWIKPIIGVAGGLNISQLRFKTGVIHREYMEGSYKNSVVPTIGISINLLTPRLSERLSFTVDALYSAHSFESSITREEAIITRHHTIDIGYKQVKIPFGIRYTLPKKKVTPYMNLGVSSTFHFNSHADWSEVVENTNTNETETNNRDAFTVKNHQLGFWGGVGATYAIHTKFNAFIEFRYERTDGIAEESDGADELKSRITNFQIIVGLRKK